LRILEADVSACELFGYARPRDLIQRNLLDLLVANDRQRASCAIQGLFEGRAEAVEDELRALRENGRPRWLRCSLSLLRVSQRSAPRLRLRIFDRDTPDDRELALANRERMLCQALSHASIGMIIGSPAGRTFLMNEAMCDILGYDVAEGAYLRYSTISPNRTMVTKSFSRARSIIVGSRSAMFERTGVLSGSQTECLSFAMRPPASL
jgi:PAS domain-containing protein